MSTTYRIVVVTGTVDDAGTDSDVFITLLGTTGNSNERELDNADDNFENGNTDTFSLEMDDIGDITQVRIRHNNSGHNPGWFLDRITVHNETSHKEYNFPCHRWLAVDEDDHQIDRLLDVS